MGRGPQTFAGGRVLKRPASGTQLGLLQHDLIFRLLLKITVDWIHNALIPYIFAVLRHFQCPKINSYFLNSVLNNFNKNDQNLLARLYKSLDEHIEQIF